MMKYKETIKTITITVLVTGIVAFVAGVSYQRSVSTTTLTEAVHQVQTLKAQ